MKPIPKNPHVSSTPNLPPAIKKPYHTNNPAHQNEQTLIQHRKQIEATLNELHRLQSQIYELNVPENPHSTSPVKKQIKQLSYLYENMAKPKAKNQLSVNSTDIEIALRIMNHDWSNDMQLQPELSDSNNKTSLQLQPARLTKTNLLNNNNSSSNLNSSIFRSTIKTQLNPPQQNPADKIYKIEKQLLQQKFEKITHTPVSLSFISKNQKNQYVNTKQLYQFINFTQCQYFDPVQKAYQMFLNQDGEFDLKRYNDFNQILGLPKIKNINTFIAAIYQSQVIADGKEPTYVASVDNSNSVTARQPKNEDKKPIHQIAKNSTSNEDKKHINLIAKNSTSMTAKISFQQFKKVLDLQL